MVEFETNEMSRLEELTVRQGELILNTPNRAEILKAGPPRDARSNVLGKGAFGTVFKAIFRDQDVAVKVMRNANAIQMQAIKNEAHILSWKHRNIVKIMKVESTPNFGLIIMERFSGQSLNVVLDKCELILPHRINISLDVLSALAYCHKRKLLHLDVKPQNIYVTCCMNEKSRLGLSSYEASATRRQYICKLCDFGSSLRLNEQSDINYCSKTIVRGTMRYMSPEMIRGLILAPSSDIYSLGITMWQMLQRQLPYYWIECNEAVAYQVTKHNLRPDALQSAAEKRDFVHRLHTNNCLKQFPTQTSSSSNSPTLINCADLKLNIRWPMQEIVDLNRDVLCATKTIRSIEKFNYNTKWIFSAFASSANANYVRNANKENTYRELYQWCWLNEPQSRPNAQQLFASLKRLC